MSEIQTIYKKILHLGADKNEDMLYKQRLQLVNYLSFWLIVITFVIMAIVARDRDYKVLLIETGLIFLVLIPTIYLNYIGKLPVAKWYFYGFGLVMITLLSAFNIHRKLLLDTQVVIFGILAIGVFLFDGYELLLAFGLALVAYFGLWYYQYFNTLVYLGTPFRQFVNPLSAFIIIAIVFTFYKKLRNKFEKTILIQKNDLEMLNAELKAQAEEIVIINETLENQKRDLEEANATKDRLFSVIAHDLRVPFRTLKSMFDLMDIADLQKEEKEFFLKKIRQYNQDTAHLLDNLLLWARNQMNAEKVQPQPIVWREIVQKSLNLLEEVAAAKKIKIEVTISDNFLVWADADMLDFVVRNLISNAIKFSEPNSSIRIAIYREEAWGVLEAIDSGVGIEPERIPSIFQPNHQKSWGTENETGTGLGLPLCKVYVEKNQGQILVESQKNRGSKFIVKLPIYVG